MTGRRTHDEDQYPIAAPADTSTLEADTVGAPQGTLRRMRTFDSFKYRDFRLFFAGALLSNVGSWMQMAALGWLVYDLTGRSGSLGAVNFLAGAPIFFLTVFTGALADHVNRRVLLIVTQVALMLQAAAFGWLSMSGHVTMAWIYALSLMGGLANAFMSPAWQAMTPDLVPRESLLNAIALSSAQFNAARLVGPMAAAFVVLVFSGSRNSGITEIFFVNAASFIFVIWALAVIRPRQQARRAIAGESPLQMLTAGVKYAASHRRVRMHLLTAAMLTIFGMPHATLLPAIARETLHLGVSGFSGLMAANGLGALVGALTVASLPVTVRRESIVRGGLLVMSLGAILLSLSTSTALSMATLVVMGVAFLACVSSINTNLQTAVPPHLRGRVMSLFVLSFMGMMPFGAIAFGALGDLIGAPHAVLAGALVLLAWALFLVIRPSMLCSKDDPDCA